MRNLAASTFIVLLSVFFSSTTFAAGAKRLSTPTPSPTPTASPSHKPTSTPSPTTKPSPTPSPTPSEKPTFSASAIQVGSVFVFDDNQTSYNGYFCIGDVSQLNGSCGDYAITQNIIDIFQVTAVNSDGSFTITNLASTLGQELTPLTNYQTAATFSLNSHSLNVEGALSVSPSSLSGYNLSFSSAELATPNLSSSFDNVTFVDSGNILEIKLNSVYFYPTVCAYMQALSNAYGTDDIPGYSVPNESAASLNGSPVKVPNAVQLYFNNTPSCKQP